MIRFKYVSLSFTNNIFDSQCGITSKVSQLVCMNSNRNPNSYAIWFIPNNKKFLLLEEKIIEMSQFFQGIKFIPHVTLISNIDCRQNFLLKKVKRIAKTIPVFKIYLSEIDYSNEFFRSFFIKVELNNHLTYARKIALMNFPEINHDFKPHLSLAYGNMNDKMKKNLKEKVQTPIKFFKAKELYLVYNDEINFKWKIIDKFLLKK